MKDKITKLMKLRFASQWMEIIVRNGAGSNQMGRWRTKIKSGDIHDGLVYTSCVGLWSGTPQGYQYWSDRTHELDDLLSR